MKFVVIVVRCFYLLRQRNISRETLAEAGLLLPAAFGFQLGHAESRDFLTVIFRCSVQHCRSINSRLFSGGYCPMILLPRTMQRRYKQALAREGIGNNDTTQSISSTLSDATTVDTSLN